MSKPGIRMPARWARRLFLAALGAVVLVGSQLASPLSAGTTPALAASAAPGQPNPFHPSASAKPVLHTPPAPKAATPSPTSGSSALQRGAAKVTMQPALVPLDPATGGHFGGRAGALEL